MATVTINGEAHEVDLDAITFEEGEVPGGFVTTERLQSEVQRRVAGARRTARVDYLKDDTFFREAAAHRGIELREDGQPKGASKDDKAALERFKAQYLTPLEEKLEGAQQSVERYRRRALEADILQAAAELGIKDTFMKPVSAGASAPIVTLLRDALAYDSESDSWALHENGQIRYDEHGKPAGARVLIEEMRGGEAYADYFKNNKMQGANHSGITNTTARTYTNAEIEAMSLDEFEKSEASILQAMREGRIRD